ncbi:hypothetical protein WHR41_08327 [Cladosporium halotolerans]|uniref:Glycine zipper 2TM domain-containing protein n=1 Tax=Cladosporium halotolerans TaxID=1052096 RepID=A0AB34KD32_9PEZI
MASNRSQIVDVTYDDPRTGERIRERRIQEVPPDEMEDIRTRELEVVNKSRSQSRGASKSRERSNRWNEDGEGEQQYYAFRRTMEHGVPGHEAFRSRSYDRPLARGRGPQRYYEEPSDSESSRERRYRDRRRRHSHRRRTQSEDDYYEGMKQRRDGNLWERNFDNSYDGIIAGAAGAALGAMTARHFGGEKNRNWKVLGGAVAGAAATNAAENWYRTNSEERRARKERR